MSLHLRYCLFCVSFPDNSGRCAQNVSIAPTKTSPLSKPSPKYCKLLKQACILYFLDSYSIQETKQNLQMLRFMTHSARSSHMDTKKIQPL